MKKILFGFLAFLLILVASPAYAAYGNCAFGDCGPITISQSNGIYSSDAWVDPVSTSGSNGSIAAGIVTTTTGTIASGTSSLSVASATGWSVGMGIAVANAGTGGNTELITYITGISGTTFTLATTAITTATAQTVSHDDTRALTTAIQSGKNVHLRAGNYNVTSVLNITSALLIQGDGNRGRNIATGETLTTMGTAIINRGTTNNVITDTTVGDTGIFDLAILQNTSITPTQGFGIIFGDNSVKMLNTKLNNVTIYGTWGGLKIGGGVSIAFYTNLWIVNTASGSTTSNAIYVDNPTPNGDINWANIYVQNKAATPGIGIHIVNADTMGFHNIKVNVSDPDMLIDDKGGAGNVSNIRFTNCSFESQTASTNPLVKLTATNAGGVSGVTITGGEFGVSGTNQYGVLIDTNVRNVSITGNVFSNTGGGVDITSTQGYNTVTANIFKVIAATAVLVRGATSNYNSVMGNICYSVTTCVKNLGDVLTLSTLGNIDSTILGYGTLDGNGYRVSNPTSQTIGAGGTVAADGCGSIKQITSAGAVTTDTTNTFTAPAITNKNCIMDVCNVGANNITLDNNANFKSFGGLDVVMTADDCVRVMSTGASGKWYQVTGLEAN